MAQENEQDWISKCIFICHIKLNNAKLLVNLNFITKTRISSFILIYYIQSLRRWNHDKCTINVKQHLNHYTRLIRKTKYLINDDSFLQETAPTPAQKKHDVILSCRHRLTYVSIYAHTHCPLHRNIRLNLSLFALTCIGCKLKQWISLTLFVVCVVLICSINSVYMCNLLCKHQIFWPPVEFILLILMFMIFNLFGKPNVIYRNFI